MSRRKGGLSEWLEAVSKPPWTVSVALALVRRLRSRALLDDARRGATESIASLSRQDFERLVAEGFRHRGFLVTERRGGEPDGDIDMALARGNERFLVQCKQWRAQSVSVLALRELHAVMAAEGAVGGFAVTLGTFSMDARKFASGRNIELIDGRGLSAFFAG
jgi:restriction system protein